MFIKATKEFNTFDRAVAAPYLRKSFESKRATSGVIEITACGFYELYFNGRRITKGFLSPYISNTEHLLYVDKYEVEIEKGENVIGILLGNGLQNNPGGWIWGFDKYTHRGAPKVALTLSFDDVIIESDQSFKTHPSPISYDDYRYGEMYDANFEIEGWNEKGYFDDEWGNAILAEAPKGELRICEAEPIVKDFEIKPIGIFSEEDGFVYDFGVNHTGVCRLELE
ncbi:MAG: alpha-L-rhamnosidase N-terminal domain-containing protein, partial [Clostridia bacterium]|nr:alpha-L-rhamnosidase N-terminal domain-containing protein [Clostridia bacterium]